MPIKQEVYGDVKPREKKKDPAAAFKKIDANSDGKVSLEEFTAGKDGTKKERAAAISARFPELNE